MSPDEREQPFEVKDRCPNCERLTALRQQDLHLRRVLHARVDALEAEVIGLVASLRLIKGGAEAELIHDAEWPTWDFLHWVIEMVDADLAATEGESDE